MILLEFQLSQLDRAAADIAGYLLGIKANLYQTPVAISQSTPLSAFTAAVATFTGYTAHVVTWDTPSVADDGTVEVLGSFVAWRPTDGVTPNVIWGVYITDGAGALLYFAGQFEDAPLPMGGALDQITIVMRYRPADKSLIVTIS